MSKLVRHSLIIFLIINLLYVISGVIHYPMHSIDVFAIWLFKAKAIYLAQGLPLEILQDPLYSYTHPEYPLLLPYIFSKIYQLVNGVKEIYVLLLYPAIYLLILLLTYLVFRLMNLSINLSLLFTYIYSMFSPLLAQAGRKQAGNADILLVLINWLGIYILYKYYKIKPLLTGWLIVLLAMIASQIKLEGLFLASMLIFLSKSYFQRFKFLLVVVLPFIIWQLTRFKFATYSNYKIFIPDIANLINRLFIIFYSFTKEMKNLNNWYIFWPIFILSGFYKSPQPFIIRKVILPTLLLMSVLFIPVYLFSITDTLAYTSSSIDRIMLQLSPFFYLVFVNWTHKIISKKLT